MVSSVQAGDGTTAAANVPTSRIGRGLRQIARILSIPTVAFGSFFFTMLMLDHTPFLQRPHVVTEKSNDSPGRYRINIENAPNARGGRGAISDLYPKWLYDKVQIGDTLYAGPAHYWVTRNGSLVTLYFPTRHFPVAWMPLAWCLPAVLWLRRPRMLRSMPVVLAALASEGWFVWMMIQVLAERFSGC
jgi:hypothetical protein